MDLDVPHVCDAHTPRHTQLVGTRVMHRTSTTEITGAGGLNGSPTLLRIREGKSPSAASRKRLEPLRGLAAVGVVLGPAQRGLAVCLLFGWASYSTRREKVVGSMLFSVWS